MNSAPAKRANVVVRKANKRMKPMFFLKAAMLKVREKPVISIMN